MCPRAVMKRPCDPQLAREALHLFEARVRRPLRSPGNGELRVAEGEPPTATPPANPDRDQEHGDASAQRHLKQRRQSPLRLHGPHVTSAGTSRAGPLFVSRRRGYCS